MGLDGLPERVCAGQGPPVLTPNKHGSSCTAGEDGGGAASRSRGTENRTPAQTASCFLGPALGARSEPPAEPIYLFTEDEKTAPIALFGEKVFLLGR